MGAAVGLDGFEPPKERVLGIALANSDDSALSSLSMDGFFFDFVDVAPKGEDGVLPEEVPILFLLSAFFFFFFFGLPLAAASTVTDATAEPVCCFCFCFFLDPALSLFFSASSAFSTLPPFFAFSMVLEALADGFSFSIFFFALVSVLPPLTSCLATGALEALPVLSDAVVSLRFFFALLLSSPALDLTMPLRC